MNQITNRLSAFFRKATASTLALLLGISVFASPVEARLIFTTEGDGNLVDQDLDGDGDFSLFFGSDLSAEIQFDTSEDDFDFNKGIDVTGNVTVTGTTDLQGNVSDSLGDFTIDDNTVITGTADIQGNISDSLGNVTVDDALDVTGNIDAQGTISDSTGNLTLDDAVDVTGALDVQGGDITLENDESISNSTDGTIDLNATNVDTSNNLNVGNNLDVTGTTTLDGDVTLNNDAQIINLRAENQATGSAPTCADASDLGRIYYDTDTEELLYCYDTGSGFAFKSTATVGNANVDATFIPEFGSFATLADGSNNRGTLSAGFDDTANHGFYQWTTRQNSLNDYDLVVQWKVPENFDSFQTNAINVTYKTATTTAGDNQIDLVGEDTAGTALTLSAAATDMVSAVADTWESVNVTITGGTFTPGSIMNLKFKVQADDTSNGETFLGPVKIQYVEAG